MLYQRAAEEVLAKWREVELGASVESALGNMVKRMGSTDLRLMVMVITIQHSVGGDLPAIHRRDNIRRL